MFLLSPWLNWKLFWRRERKSKSRGFHLPVSNINKTVFNKTILIDYWLVIDYFTYHPSWLSEILSLFFLVDTSLVILVEADFAFQLWTSIDFSTVCAKALNWFQLLKRDVYFSSTHFKEKKNLERIFPRLNQNQTVFPEMYEWTTKSLLWKPTCRYIGFQKSQVIPYFMWFQVKEKNI